jgi:hypothetical protein
VAAATRTKSPTRIPSVAAAIAAAALAVVVAGCGGSGNDPTQARERHDLMSYVRQIEPLRLDVNKLLDGADPILGGYDERRLTAAEAQRRMERLERRFARYVTEVAAVKPVPPLLKAAQRAYAHTYVQEDAYLRALVAALPARRWDSLPRTEPQQRRALVAWRAAVALEAARLNVPLPADLAVAGRDEIAPSPVGDDD